MQRVLVSMLVICGMAASAAADGVYFTETVGGASIAGDLGERIDDPMRIRIAGGYRRKNWAIEGWFAGYIDDTSTPTPEPPSVACRGTGTGGGGCGGGIDESYDSTSGMFAFGVDIKYIRPVSRHFELYLRGGLGRGYSSGHAGNGVGLGAGGQLKGKVRALGFLFFPMFFVPWGPKVTAAVYVDHGVDFYRLQPDGHRDSGRALDARLTHLSIGWAVGTDF